MSKTIEIKKVQIRNLIMSLLIGFIILYSLEHFGKFTYLASSPINDNYGRPNLNPYISWDAKVSSIHYNSFFDNKVSTSGNGFTVSDLNFKGTDFNRYSSKSYYYTKATIADFKYGIYFSIIIFSITVFFSYFRIKLS